MCIAGMDPLPLGHEQMRIEQAPQLAQLCNTLVTVLEEGGGTDYLAALLRSCNDIIMRQHVMLLQANLVPRQALEPRGSTH